MPTLAERVALIIKRKRLMANPMLDKIAVRLSSSSYDCLNHREIEEAQAFIDAYLEASSQVKK